MVLASLVCGLLLPWQIVFVIDLLPVVQLLHKLSIHADDGPMKLMKVGSEKTFE